MEVEAKVKTKLVVHKMRKSAVDLIVLSDKGETLRDVWTVLESVITSFTLST